MAFWIFKYNPANYRLEDRLADPNPVITWTVNQHRDDIGPGDTVFLWETGSKRGIRAVMRIEDGPREMPEMENEQKYWAERDTQVKWRVLGRLTNRHLNLLHTELRSRDGLENLSVFHGFQQKTNFPVTPEEGEILLQLVQRHDA